MRISKAFAALALAGILGVGANAHAAEAESGNFKAAGCYIKMKTGVVMVVNRGEWLGQRMLQLPVGTREPGEAPEQTARREVSEELGVEAQDVEVGSLIEDMGTDKRPVFLFDCAVKGLVDVNILTPKDKGESAGAVIVNPDTMTYGSGGKAGQKVDMPFRFENDKERIQRYFRLP